MEIPRWHRRLWDWWSQTLKWLCQPKQTTVDLGMSTVRFGIRQLLYDSMAPMDFLSPVPTLGSNVNSVPVKHTHKSILNQRGKRSTRIHWWLCSVYMHEISKTLSWNFHMAFYLLLSCWDSELYSEMKYYHGWSYLPAKNKLPSSGIRTGRVMLI